MSSEMAAHTADYRQWQEFWRSTAMGQQAVAQLAQQAVAQIRAILWGRNLAILGLDAAGNYSAQVGRAGV